MGSEALNISSIEAHAGLDKLQVELLSLSALNRLPFAITVAKLCQQWPELLIDLRVCIPQTRLNRGRGRSRKVAEDIILTC